ncbi:MAG: hypothetical protein IPL89_16055 [Acidobacteria bacterium]|nr:hypothetical protein [Acidobacteriota bacterium]
MKSVSRIVMCGAILSVAAGAASAQQPSGEDRVAALKSSLASSKAVLRQYEWIQTTVVNVKGEDKSTLQDRCYYGADGALQKVPVGAAPEEKKKGGLRGKIIENKKEEMSDYMKEAVALVKRYLPPDPAKIDAVKAAGRLSVSPQPGNRVRVTLAGYLKPGDSLAIDMNMADNTLASAAVVSTMDSDNAPVSLAVQFGKLDNGAVYESQTILDAKGKELKVTIQNSGYRKM